MCETCGCEMQRNRVAEQHRARVDAARTRSSRSQRPLTWDEVRDRNPVERIKFDKHPYDILDELPQLIETSYEDIDEEDVLRLQWWGLYHDKPKLGNFMMRVKIPGGLLMPPQLRTIGEISQKFGRSEGEITTRQDIQLHWIKLEAVPEILAFLKRDGLTTAGACGDILRNITGCPVAGVDPNELFDTTPVVEELASFFQGNREYSDLPRKHKWTVSACPHWCNAPEIHDGALIGTRQGSEVGFAVWVGGGQASVPRIGKPLGIFIRPEEALAIVRGIIDIYKSDLRYRRSRSKARFKFMVDDDGPEVIRQKLESHLGRTLTPLKGIPLPAGRTDHMGIHPEKHRGLHYVGFPVMPGLISGEQMIAVADIVEERGLDIRLTREQNLIVTGVATEEVDALVSEMDEVGLRLDVNPIHGKSIACTGDPHCNFSVGETKPRLVRLVDHLDRRFGKDIADLRIHLDGCPHACGQHWVGDIGIQATTKSTKQGRSSAYNIMLRGGLGPEASIAKVVARRVPTGELEGQVERLVEAYLSRRSQGESFAKFCRRTPDEELLGILAGDATQSDKSGHAA